MKKKAVDKDYKKRFEKGFKLLCSSKSSYQVWSDCMALFAITLANQSILPMTEFEQFKEIWDKREKEYLRIINNYSKKRTETFPTNVCIDCKRIRRKTKSRPIR